MRYLSEKFLYLLLFGVVATGFAFTGCGGDDDDAGSAGDTEESATDESSEATDESSATADGSYSERFKNEMIEVSKTMIDVAESVESVADAEDARPKIEQSMKRMTTMFEDLADNIDNMSTAELKDLGSMQNIMEDPELKKWMDKSEAAMDKMKADHPEAAKRLKEIGEESSREFASSMMAVMMKIGSKLQMSDSTGQGAAAPEGDAETGE